MLLLSVCLQAHQVKWNIHRCYCFKCSVLSFCNTLPVPANLISTQTDLPIAGSLQLYLGTLFDTPHPLHSLCLEHTRIFTVTTTAKHTGRACELFVSVDTPQIPYQSPSLIWSHWSCLPCLLTSSMKPTTMTGRSRWKLFWKRKVFLVLWVV